MRRGIKPVRFLSGEVDLPGDKSISHRALIFGAMASGKTDVQHFLQSEDTRATEACLQSMGIEIESAGDARKIIRGKGLDSFMEPSDVLNARNSGTTMRLLLGLLAGRNFFSVMTGDGSLRRRPMGRVVDPLRQMGATIHGRRDGGLAPLAVRGGALRGIHYRMPVASAQVKSAIMLAAAQAEGETVIEEMAVTRDHTERFFEYFGYPIEKSGNVIRVKPGGVFSGRDVFVPGDFSSAAFFLVAGLCVQKGSLRIRDVGLNPTRTAFLDVLWRMGGKISLEKSSIPSHEPTGTLMVTPSELKGTPITLDEVSNLIDELPVFAVAASRASGPSVVRGASELRVKESDRIRSLCVELAKLGVAVEELPDGFVVEGPCELRGATVDSHGDHRLAMAFAVAGLLAEGETLIEGAECVDISFPRFFETLEALTWGR